MIWHFKEIICLGFGDNLPEMLKPIVSLGDTMHDILNPVFCKNKNKKYIINLTSAD